jgi:uncharacterized repeat protein (TIGR01451 family)
VTAARRVAFVAGLLAAAATLIVPAPFARADSLPATAPQAISWLTPLPRPHGLQLPRPPEENHCGSHPVLQDWESNVVMSVNPTNPANLVTAHQQDWADAEVVEYSFDAGRTWSTVVPRTTACTWRMGMDAVEPPGPPASAADFSQFNSAYDESLSFGPDGIAYLASNVTNPTSTHTATLVNRSLDGGRTWSDPAVLKAAFAPCAPGTEGLNCVPTGEVVDVVNATADPSRPGHAYVAYDVFDFPTLVQSEQVVSHTTDGGETWCGPPGPCEEASPPTPIPSHAGELAAVTELQVLRDGTLVDVFTELPHGQAKGAIHGPATIWATRLRNPTDPASTWSDPVRIAVASDARNIGIKTAVGPDGALYVVWVEADTPEDCPPAPDQQRSCFKLMYAKSADGGLTWPNSPLPSGTIGPPIAGPPPAAGDPPQLAAGVAMMPAVTVADDGTPHGTLGVAFYDHRNDDDKNDATNPLVTDYWLRHSHDGGANWTEQHLAGPFNKQPPASWDDPSTPTVEGPSNPLGQYPAIAPFGGGFATAFPLHRALPGANFSQAPCPPAPDPPIVDLCPPKNTDIFFSHIGSAADLSLTNADSPDPVGVAELLTYTLDVTNYGPTTASSVTLTDVLPKSARLRSTSSDHGRCAQRTTTRIECNLAELQSGETATVTIVARPTKKGTIVNTATVGASQPVDLNPANNTASATTTVTP